MNRDDGPPLLVGALHLAVLWAFAFQRPLFDLLGDNADFFVVRGNTRADILTFAIAFTFVPPLLMLGAEWVALRIRPSIYRGLHLVLLGLLGAAFFLQFLKDNIASGPAGVLIVLALALGAGLAAVYARTAFTKQALTVLSPAPLLFLLVFLLLSPVHKLILPQKAVAAEKIEVKSKTPIVFVIFDELPITTLMNADEGIDAKRYPNFAELAKGSTWHRNTTTIASYTTRATPAIMDGYDPRGRLPVASDQPHSIYTLLGGSYRMNVDETATSVCPERICHVPEVQVSGGQASAASGGGTRFRTRMRQLASDLRLVSEHLLLPDGIAESLPPVDQTFGNFGGNGEGSGGGNGGVAVQALNETVREGAFTNRKSTFEDFVKSVKATPKTLNLIHIEIPHVPWVYLPSGQDYDTHSPDLPLHHGQWAKSQYAVNYAYLRHLLQVGMADRMLGELIARMKKTGLWNKAIFVVTADHGVSFIADTQRRDPRPETVGGIAHVPFFIRAPGRGGGEVDDSHKCTTDVLPVIASLLRITMPWPGYHCSDEVHVAKFDGQPLSLPLGTLLKKRAAVLEEMLRLFGNGDWARTYRFGPEAGLIGTQASSVLSATGSGKVSLQNDFSSVDPSADRVPVIVQGTVSGVPAGEPVAIAVNGTIEATGETFAYMGATRVAATIPVSSLRSGRNSVEVFRISGTGGSAKLQSMGGANL